MTPELKKVYDCLDKIHLDDIKVYNLYSFHPLFDYVFVATANNLRLLHASINHIREELGMTYDIRRVEGNEDSLWLLFDLGDIIIHVMLENERKYYGLDFIYHEYLIEG